MDQKIKARLRTAINANIFCIWGEGDFNLALLKDMIAAVDAYERQTSPLHRFMDLSRLTSISLDYQQLAPLARTRRAVGRRYGNQVIKVALFASTPVSFGLARMYESLMESENILVSVFDQLEQAAAWLNVSEQALLFPD